jgi:hypothetical protein
LKKKNQIFALVGFGFPFGPASLAARPAPASSPSRSRARARAWRRGAAAAFGRRVAARRRSRATRALWPPQRPRPLTPLRALVLLGCSLHSPSPARSSSSRAPPRHRRLPSSATALAAAPAHRLRLRLRPRCAFPWCIRCSPQPARIRPPPAVMARRSFGRAHRSDPLRGPHPSTPLLAHFSSARAPHLHREAC